MLRVFKWVAMCHIGLLMATMVLGWSARSHRYQNDTSTPNHSVPEQRVSTTQIRIVMTQHMGLAVFSLLLSCMIHAVVFTYFTVTGKLIQQALALGKFDVHAGMKPIKQLKTVVSRCVGASMLPVICSIATGAWALGGPVDGRWHLVIAMLITIVHIIVYTIFQRCINTNVQYMDNTMSAYNEVKHRAEITTNAQKSTVPPMAISPDTISSKTKPTDTQPTIVQ